MRKTSSIAALLTVLLVSGCASGASQTSVTRDSSPAASSGAVQQVDIEPPANWSDLVRSLPPNSSTVSNAGATLQVVGNCDSNNGSGMLLKGSGFPANGFYRASVLKPDKTTYGYYDGNGRFDKNGQPSGWEWNCSDVAAGQATRDPVGTYILKFRDVTPGSPTNGVEFTLHFRVRY